MRWLADLPNRPGLIFVGLMVLTLAASRFYFGPGELERSEIYTDFAHTFSGWVLGVWFGVWWIAGHRFLNAYFFLFAILAFAELAVQGSRLL